MPTQRYLFIIAAIVSLCAGPVTADDQQPVEAELTRRIVLPLDNGHLDMNVLLARIIESVGFDASALADLPAWKVDVTGRLGSMQLYALRGATRGAMDLEVDQHQLTIIIDRIVLRRQEKQMRTRLRALMNTWFPKQAADAAQGYGTRQWVTGENSVPVEEAKLSTTAIVLVHGLDDGGGRVWSELTPKLLELGFTTLEFRYPNDQPIADAAQAFADELAALRTRGVERVSIVAHSMGGLVARETLTNPDIYAGQGDGGEAYPAVGRLIMVGTPNHGSKLARLHLATEARDQIVRALSGDGMLFGAIFDGAGEAEVDLLPGSEFLTTLNARPLPQGVKMTTLAGNTSPVTRARVENLRDAIAEFLPDDAATRTAELFEALLDVVDGMGDGAVPVESARLEGVDDHIDLDANHVTMLRRMPGIASEYPAIPIILERLRDDRDQLASDKVDE